MSKPEDPDVFRTSLVAIWHVGHCGEEWWNMIARLDRAGALHTLGHRYLPGRAVMESASNLGNFAAVPFCSHSKTIKQIVSEVRRIRIQLRQLP
jgi:hypothetical protein